MRLHHRLLAVLICGLAWLLAADFCRAQPAAAKLPDGLRFVPPDALGFVHIRVGEFLGNPIGQDLLKALGKDREASAGLKEMEKTLGIEIGDLESVTVLMLAPMPGGGPMGFPSKGKNARPPVEYELRPTKEPKEFKRDFEPRRPDPEPRKDGEKKEEAASAVMFVQPIAEDESIDVRDVLDSGPLVILTSAKPLDRKKILRMQWLMPRGGPFGRDATPDILFLSDRSVLAGRPEQLGHYTEQMARKPAAKSHLEHALALAAEPHLIVAGGYMPPSLRRLMVPINVPPLVSPLLVTDAALTLDFGKALDLTLSFKAPTEASAGLALQAVKNLGALGEMVLETPQKGGAANAWKADLEKAFGKALATAVYEQKDRTASARLKVDADPALVQHLVKHVVTTMQQKAGRTQSVNNLKQIALAAQSYHDAYRQLPPVRDPKDPNGKPFLSWRVAILPFIDEVPLYNEFDLTKPWDHPTNKKLIPRMPKVYMIPGVETKEGMTHYRVLVGPQTAFEPGQKITLVGITDGTSNTIMAVEAAEPTIWTRPDDLPFDPKGPLPKFGVWPDGFNAAFCDGTVRFIPASTPPATIRAYITRNGGEVVQLPD